MTEALSASLRVATFRTALGWMAGEWQADRLCHLVFGYGTSAAALAQLAPNCRAIAVPLEDQPRMMHTITRLKRYAEGDPQEFLDVDVDLRDQTKFQRQVIWHCRRIARGETLTYGQLAAGAGFPGAARAVGRVMATNRIPLIIPCHRVVSASGRLGGFSAPGGLRMKQRLLCLEGAASPHKTAGSVRAEDRPPPFEIALRIQAD